MNHLVRRVVVHPNLFEHDLLLFGEFSRVEYRVEKHVAENIDRERDVMIDDLCVVAGRLFIGERVEIAADAIHGLRDLARRPKFRPLEEHMLDEV